MRDRLPEEEIVRRLSGMGEWTRAGESITRTFRFTAFTEAIGFVTRVADLAERKDHHPDIDIRYDLVSLRLSTHSAGGLTALDFEFAGAVDTL
jgi:4a-hydroxytetrahydrobiopterin dehydratase